MNAGAEGEDKAHISKLVEFSFAGLKRQRLRVALIFPILDKPSSPHNKRYIFIKVLGVR